MAPPHQRSQGLPEMPERRRFSSHASVNTNDGKASMRTASMGSHIEVEDQNDESSEEDEDWSPKGGPGRSINNAEQGGKWHRYSWMRTDPASWEEYKTAKPKQPLKPRPRVPSKGVRLERQTEESLKQMTERAQTFKNLKQNDASVKSQMQMILTQPSFQFRTGHHDESNDSTAHPGGSPGAHNQLSTSTESLGRVRPARKSSMTAIGGFSSKATIGGGGKDDTHALKQGSQTLSDIRSSFIEMLVSSSDPQGDFSWSVSDPRAYQLLPLKLIECRDWHGFRVLMCDLRFLWRKITENGAMSVLQAYKESLVPLTAEGLSSERITDYYDFIYEHVKTLTDSPNSIFKLGINCKQQSVRRETQMLVQQYDQIIREWHDMHTSEGAGAKGAAVESAGEHRKQHVSAFETMRYVHMKFKLTAIHECGISACLTEASGKRLNVLIERLVQKCQSSRSRLLERGLNAYSEENRAVLGLDSGEGGAQDLEQPKQFLDLAGLWDESDKVEFVALSIYIPPKTWNNEKLRDQYETHLCQQIAEAAHAPLELIDIVDIACPEKEVKSAMYGKCLVKCMELVKGLQVTVVAGKDFPMMDQVGKSDPFVTLNLRTSRGRGSGNKSERRTKSVGQKQLPRMALKSQSVVHQTTSRPGELNPINPHFDEQFSFLVYDLGQDLVVVCYDQDNGGKTPIGEIVLNIEDIFSQCHTYDDETFERSCALCKPGTKKPVTYRTYTEGQTRTPYLNLKFRFFTHQSPNGVSPHTMANSVMQQARDRNSPLRLGMVVTSPAFHDEEGSWDTVNVYLSSSYSDFHAERRYLNRYVFPALAVECLNQRLHFKWTDLSEYGASGVKDDVVKRIDSVETCRIRGYDHNGDNIHSTFMVALLGEKRGRLLDGHDIRRLEKAESQRKGKYEWALEAAKQGASVQELEVRAGLLNVPSASQSVVCMREPFMEDEAFQSDVPKHVKACFTESDISGRTAVGQLKRNVMRTAGQSVVHYQPSFMSFSEAVPETKENGEPEHVAPDKASQGVQLGGLEEFGLEVFERLWRLIRQRFPSSRAKSPVNGYVIEHVKQVESIRSYVRPFHLMPGMTQKLTLSKLQSIAQFVNEAPPVTFLVGGHGSGKSSLLARMVYDLNVLPKKSTDTAHDDQEKKEGVKEEEEQEAKVKPDAMMAVLMRTKTQMLKTTQSKKSILAVVPSGAVGGLVTQPTMKKDKKSFDGLADPEDFEFGDEDPEDEELNGDKAPVEMTEEEQALAEGAVQRLMQRGVSPDEIMFLSRRPRIVFFVKHPHHSDHDLISYLCSSLLRRQDNHHPSWKRLEHLVRCRVFERPMLSGDQTTPVLFVLDGLSMGERNQVQSIVSGLKGKARAIMSIQSSSLGDIDDGVKLARSWSGSQVILNGPLANQERNEILTKLFDRLGAKKKPSNLDVITLRQAAGSPLYLSVVSSYIGSLVSLYKRPAPLKDLKRDVVSLIVHDFLPIIEKVAGESNVRVFLEVVMQEPGGRIKKDVHAILFKCGFPITDATLRYLTDAFRPFSDPVHSSHGGTLSLNRPFLKEAVRRRYRDLQVPSGLDQMIREMKVTADAQEARLNMVQYPQQSTNLVSMTAMYEDDEEDAEWLSDGEEQEEGGEEDEEQDEQEQVQVTVFFGNVGIHADRALFEKFNGDATVQLSNRSGTMDMNELVKMLRYLDALPQHVTKTEIARAFRGANRDHGGSGSADNDVHELDFKEFLDCMSRLQDLYMNRLNMMGSEHEKAAVLIQRRARGNAARKEARKKKNEQIAVAVRSADEFSHEEVKSIIKVQSVARMKKEKEKRQRNAIMQHAKDKEEKSAISKARPAIKGKLNRPGAIGVVQARLIELFDKVQDAFVYIDNDGNDQLTKVEFARGLQRLGITGASIGKLSAMVAADGLVDVLEFMRLFAWHDVRHVDKAIAESKVGRSLVLEKATARLNDLKEGKSHEDITTDLDSLPKEENVPFGRRGSSSKRFQTMHDFKYALSPQPSKLIFSGSGGGSCKFSTMARGRDSHSPSTSVTKKKAISFASDAGRTARKNSGPEEVSKAREALVATMGSGSFELSPSAP